MESLDHFGANLRKLREDAEYTQTALAEKLGAGNVYLSQLEAGSRRPSADMMLKIAVLLRCTVSDLLCPPKRGRRP